MKTIVEYLINNHVDKNHANGGPYHIATDRSEGGKHEFSSDELEELMKYVESDEDFIELYQSAKNPRYHSMEEAVMDFEEFLNTDVYSSGDDTKEVHAFYILDHEGDGGYSYMVLTTGKVVNTDNLYAEFNSIVNDK